MKTIKERFSSINKIGLEKNFFEDLYHKILVMPWLNFFFFYVVFFVAFNLFFGWLYFLESGSVSGTNDQFFKNFSFSVQTFSTIGYGVYSPATNYAHSLVIIESICSVILTALLTGLTFAKFAKPSARIRFTEKVVITNYKDKPTLMLRLANMRGNQIAEASIKAIALVTDSSPEGHRMRIQKDIKFIRETSSFFVLSWTVMHVIDETSPFYNLSFNDLKDQNIDLSVSVIGHDESFSQNVHASCVYSPEDFIFNKNFADIISSENGKATTIDYTQFNKLI
ncbi:MAG: ion channel [Pseudobdellovibrio sp.]